MLLKKSFLSILIIFVLMIQSVYFIYAKTVIVSGESVGIELQYPGVIITGGYDITVDQKTYNPLEEGLKLGDIIIAINNTPISSLSQLSNQIQSLISQNKEIDLTIQRDLVNFPFSLEVETNNSQTKTGLYVKDRLLGVGTLTFIDEEQGTFGALGHAMNDSQFSELGLLQDGTLYSSVVTDIQKATNTTTGQKYATIGNEVLGEISIHSDFGIYGTIEENSYNSTYEIETASQEEIELGEAYFLTVLQGDKIEKVFIEITDVAKQNSSQTKGITFTITDKDVLEKTNGIIQGMSGSPIIQNDKLIGAVTHVFVNEPTQGYGIFIDIMLDVTQKIE